jgi:ubiquinone/menaquinone biosynthesis C-methylase UbiE
MTRVIRQTANLGRFVDENLPPYAERLDAMHRALVDDFTTRIMARLPLKVEALIVDVGCGDGFFTGLLAERVPKGQAVGLDTSPAFLAAAGKRLVRHISTGGVRLVDGDVNKFPFQESSVDAIWSGHSMQSYEAIPHVLSEFRRVLRPGGLLAILETDNIHSIMLSWPPDLELAVRQAEHREIGSEDSYIGTYFPRFATRLVHEAGFEDFRREYVFIYRQKPCEALTRYIELYLQNLFEQVGERLTSANRQRLQELSNPESSGFLPRQENFFFGSLQVLMTARASESR